MKTNEGLRVTGAVALGLTLFFAAFCLIGLFAYGIDWASGKIMPLLIGLCHAMLVFALIVLAPLAFFPKTRTWAATGLILTSDVYALTVWVWCMLLTHILWGMTAVVVGVLLLGIGIIPVGMLASAMKGSFWPLAQLLVFLAIAVGTRLLGYYLLAKSAPRRSPTALSF